ncbi:hypothetical protein F3087_29715 [Nocardia colli]|uniref:Type IV toxin-antitoxin system AbiEi family antitoxin domain-containing protein n=1 Tax=Nocardia colli TaxID=2545717 RepID=A0A5N0E8G3_9NOCA|nr:hypothetical protein [Nocardia colli]KAA8885030.1 hypothetical protein F3087_29715 [Nocardia colli]
MEATPIQRRDALAKGFSDGELRRLIARCGLLRLRPGAYLEAESYRAMDQEARYHVLVHATAGHLSAPAVISHQSAAAVHGLPLWGLPLDTVHVTRQRSGGGHRGKHLHVHCAPFEDEDVAEVGSLLVLSPARTIADIARNVGLQQAVAIGDAAARQFGSTRESFCRALTYAARRPGYRAALRAIGMLDGRSESIGESRSRVVLNDLDLPSPELQTTILDDAGRFVARVDFCFDELGIIGEFDGKVKYGSELNPGEDPGRTLYREKLREDRLRDLGWEVARWTWSDLDTPATLDARFRRAIARTAHRPRPIGSVIDTPRSS